MFNKARLGIVRHPVDMPDIFHADPASGEVPVRRVLVDFLIYKRRELRDKRRLAMRTTGDAIHSITAKVQRGESVDPAAELEEEFKKIEAAEDTDEAELRRRIKGWTLVDDDGNAVPCTPEFLDAVLEVHPWFEALRAGLGAASRGALAKNSPPGPAGTPGPAQSAATTGSGAQTTASSTT